MTLAPITAPTLDHPRIAHGFFTREGGVSTGLYASLNGGTGSRDDRAAVTENRRRMAETLGVAADHLVLPHLVHSPDAVAISAPFSEAERPRCDGLVTRTPGLALGVTGADCGIVLLADAETGIVGACHAGWKGAVYGVLESTVAAMLSIGATRAGIAAVLGPTIGRESYEVGPEFRDRVVERNAADATFFTGSGKTGHHHFDLPGFIINRLRGTDIGRVDDLALDTYADEARFFSYRRATHRGEPDYGRLVGAIALRAV
jgi:polyphenol oxidase